MILIPRPGRLAVTPRPAPGCPRAACPATRCARPGSRRRRRCDGRLEEPAWDQAPPFDGFVQRFPAEGAAPTAGTTVRMLLRRPDPLLGVSCRDDRPELVQRPLGRRDNAPYGDSVTALLDSMHDGRNAFVFSISAAGVQSDGLQSEDDEYDGRLGRGLGGRGVGDRRGLVGRAGHPLDRAPLPGPRRAGVRLRREAGGRADATRRTWSIHVPRSARGQIRAAGPLPGPDRARSSAEVEVVPYVAARLALAPAVRRLRSGPGPGSSTRPRDLGLDLKTSLGRGLSLQGTMNPDFGQVEADQIVQNLTTFESFFPEKRPFFTAGDGPLPAGRRRRGGPRPSSCSTRGASASPRPSWRRPSSRAR